MTTATPPTMTFDILDPCFDDVWRFAQALTDDQCACAAGEEQFVATRTMQANRGVQHGRLKPAKDADVPAARQRMELDAYYWLARQRFGEGDQAHGRDEAGLRRREAMAAVLVGLDWEKGTFGEELALPVLKALHPGEEVRLVNRTSEFGTRLDAVVDRLGITYNIKFTAPGFNRRAKLKDHVLRVTFKNGKRTHQYILGEEDGSDHRVLLCVVGTNFQ